MNKVLLRVETEVEFELSDEQLKFVKEKFESECVKGFNFENDIVKVGEVLGVEV